MKKNKISLKKIMFTTGPFFFLTLSLFSVASAENYIGVILDGYQKDCYVQSNGEYYDCRESRQIYAGDKIIKKQNFNTLKIKWAPYAKGKHLDDTSMLALFEPPKDKKNILLAVREFVGLVKTGHNVSTGATRSAGDIVFQPGNNATLIPGQKSTFAWENEGGKHIIFKDGNGTEIFRKELKGSSSIHLTPEEIGMKPEITYLWTVTGVRNNKQYKIRVLSQDISDFVNQDLKKIDQENTYAVDKMIQKAGYLQFISNAYPKDMDFYWLSYMILTESRNEKSLNDEDLIIIKELRKNYLDHVRESM